VVALCSADTVRKPGDREGRLQGRLQVAPTAGGGLHHHQAGADRNRDGFAAAAGAELFGGAQRREI